MSVSAAIFINHSHSVRLENHSNTVELTPRKKITPHRITPLLCGIWYLDRLRTYVAMEKKASSWDKSISDICNVPTLSHTEI